MASKIKGWGGNNFYGIVKGLLYTPTVHRGIVWDSLGTYASKALK